MAPAGVSVVLCQGSLNPVYISWHPSVNTGPEWLSTAKSPAGDPNLDPGTVDNTDQWSPRVTLREKEERPVKKNILKTPSVKATETGPPKRPWLWFMGCQGGPEGCCHLAGIFLAFCKASTEHVCLDESFLWHFGLRDVVHLLTLL